MVERVPGLVEQSELLGDDAEPAISQGIAGFQGDRATIGLARLRVAPKPHQSIAKIELEPRMRRLDRQRLFITFGRLREAAQIVNGGASVALITGIAGLQGAGALETAKRLVRASRLQKQAAPIEPGDGVGWIERQGAVIEGQSARGMAARLQKIGARAQGFGKFGLSAKGFVQQSDRLIEAPLGLRAHAALIKGPGGVVARSHASARRIHLSRPA